VTASPPPAKGKRLPWSAIPARLRAEAERLLGGRVTAAETQPGGFSPGVAARLQLSNGARAFVKAVGDINPESPDIHRAEAAITAALPAGTPAPRLLGFIDDDGWVILLLEDIAGRLPAAGWPPDELDRVLAAMTALSESLTPAPIAAPPAATRYSDLGRGWRALLTSGTDHGWAARNLERCVALEAGWGDAVSGDCLAHGDIRADNVLLTADRVIFVDWPWACLAPPWFDLVTMLPSLVLDGGPEPETVLAGHPLARRADPEAVTVVAAALAGFFLWKGGQPDPPGLPTLRAFQRAQAEVALRWLQTRTGWS
jgi:aminoglycoside phosphotransferase (APT) family kinase protein